MTDATTNIAAKLPNNPDADLSKDQAEIERASIERAEKRARNLLIANIALLTSLTATQSFIDPPYFMRGFLWASLGLCVISSIFCGLSIHDADRRLNQLDLTAKKQDRKRINIFDDLSFWTFSGTFIFLAAFIAVNLFESLRTDRTTIDIVASEYVVRVGEAVSLEVSDEMGEEFRWAVSAGQLLDDNERTVTWIAPDSIAGETETVDIEVCVRRNHVFFCERDKILVSQPAQVNDAVHLRSPATALDALRIETKMDIGRSCNSPLLLASWQEYSQSADLPIAPNPVPPLVPGLPCCSTKFIKVNCNWNC